MDCVLNFLIIFLNIEIKKRINKDLDKIEVI